MFQEMTVLDTNTISPCGLVALIRESSSSTLIVDCRGFTEYNESHIKHSINAFFSKLIRRRLFENKIDDSCLVHQMMSCTGGKEEDVEEEKLDVVLYAEEDKPRANKRRIASCNAPESSAKILRVLRERLEDTNRFRSVMVLEGGYKAFASQYPQLCDFCEGMTKFPLSLSQPCLLNPNGDGITRITPFIYLGSQMDSLNEKMLQSLGITAVINLSVTCPQSVCIKDDKDFKRIPVNDSYQEKLLRYFDEAYYFLEEIKRSGKKCLIHCLAGISRSPTLCISYIMRANRIGSEEAYRFVKERRPSISPNFNFMGQLLEYESQLIFERVLRPDQASRPYRPDKVHSSIMPECYAAGSGEAELTPAKVPKSASAHCVFTELNPTQSPVTSDESASAPQQCSEEPSAQVNANGKRGMSPDLPRPKALPFLGAASAALVPKDLPSPSTELSRLTVNGGAESPVAVPESALAFTNPCFLMPMTPTREICLPLGSSSHTEMANPTFYAKSPKPASIETAEASTSEAAGPSSSAPASVSSSFEAESSSAPATASTSAESSYNIFRFKKCGGQKNSRTATNRPECLRSSGVLIPSGPVLATTEEEVESPESGFNEEMKSSPEDDSVSMSSANSLEITCL